MKPCDYSDKKFSVYERIGAVDEEWDNYIIRYSIPGTGHQKRIFTIAYNRVEKRFSQSPDMLTMMESQVQSAHLEEAKRTILANQESKHRPVGRHIRP